ncbi:MAG TPA: acetolactate synthase large subunit [Myxococcota bacterium]|jgi:acetolactate synthase-1/2/3 large subunit|nr:acetolactate synthase large subunit [Myxococcota bacterium]
MSGDFTNGAGNLIRTALDAGIEVCFANPGTTEMQLVDALDARPGIRAVLGLFEGVCAGAADGYARMARRPALTLLHLGPGLANALANLHNARRARSPVVNLVGDHATWHLPLDTPLTSDIESLARSVGWVHTVASAKDVARDTAAAIRAAREHRQVATLIVPQDASWEPVPEATEVVPPSARTAVDTDRVSAAADLLRSDPSAVLFLGGEALSEPALRAVVRVRGATGCRCLHETFPARLERGGSLPAIERLPYFPEQAAAALASVRSVVLAGTCEPVSFFGYPGQPSRLLPEGARVLALTHPDEDAAAALEALAEAFDAPRAAACEAPRSRPLRPAGPLTTEALARALVALQPEGAIVVDESATSGLAYAELAWTAPPHSVLALTGGAIGQGLPCAAGAAIACPDRKVIALHGDGGAMYTLQSLWTLARESLDVVVVICANRRYRILQIELARAGVREPGRNARALTELSEPALDWTALARGMGVPGVRAETADALSDALSRAFSQRGPYLIEAVL